MLTWGEFRAAQPEKAAAGQALLYQVGVGLGFLATVRADGGPRVHPVCPILTDDALYLFVVASPKRNDLRRDPRYALHAFPTDDNEDAFYVTGLAEPRPDPVLRPLIAEQYFGERDMKEPPAGFEDEQLFELLLDHCLVTKTTGHGDWNPQHSVWEGEIMMVRKVATGALCIMAVGALAACTSESAPSGGSTTTSTKDKSSTTTTEPHVASTWVQKWQPTLIGDYGAAQGAFLTAVNTRSPAAIKAAAAPLAAANATLRDAIVKAGPPPPDDEASATLAMIALTTEAQQLAAIQAVCTGPTEACTNALSEYAKNQQKLIILFTDLGAAS